MIKLIGRFAGYDFVSVLYLLAGYNAFVLQYILARHNVISFHYTFMLLSKSDTENLDLSWTLSSMNAAIVTNSVTVTLASGRFFVVNVMFGLLWNCVYVYVTYYDSTEDLQEMRCQATISWQNHMYALQFHAKCLGYCRNTPLAPFTNMI